jgi:hypothetical protein
MNTSVSVEKINDLVKGEMSGVETYEQALGKVEGSSEEPKIQAILNDHKEAVSKLQGALEKLGASSAKSSGAWGAFVKSIEGTARLFGNTAALKALKEGEEYGVKQYEGTLDTEGLDEECARLIRDDLLPQTKRHVNDIDQLMN